MSGQVGGTAPNIRAPPWPPARAHGRPRAPSAGRPASSASPRGPDQLSDVLCSPPAPPGSSRHRSWASLRRATAPRHTAQPRMPNATAARSAAISAAQDARGGDNLGEEVPAELRTSPKHLSSGHAPVPSPHLGSQHDPREHKRATFTGRGTNWQTSHVLLGTYLPGGCAWRSRNDEAPQPTLPCSWHHGHESQARSTW